MGVSYEPARQSVKKRALEIMHEFHPCLSSVEARIDLLMWMKWVDGELQPGLTLHGYPCAATVKVNSLKLRAQGLGDALITIDGGWWENTCEERQASVLDHEFEHLQVVAGSGQVLRYDESTRDVLGAVETDDLGRPKLALKLHDWQLGGFRSVSQRHGRHALEVIAARSHQGDGGQYVWDFAAKAGGKETR